jgi:hypothetical protein
VDKASVLAETIAYLKELEQRVEELESSRAPSGQADTAGRRRHNVVGKKVSVGSKRKASELGDGNIERGNKPGNIVNITMMDKEVLLEVQCRWKENLMTRVFDALKDLSLDVLSVQSSTPGGLLALKIRAQVWHASTSAMIDLAIEMHATFHSCSWWLYPFTNVTFSGDFVLQYAGCTAVPPGIISEALQRAIGMG